MRNWIWTSQYHLWHMSGTQYRFVSKNKMPHFYPLFCLVPHVFFPLTEQLFLSCSWKAYSVQCKGDIFLLTSSLRDWGVDACINTQIWREQLGCMCLKAGAPWFQDQLQPDTIPPFPKVSCLFRLPRTSDQAGNCGRGKRRKLRGLKGLLLAGFCAENTASVTSFNPHGNSGR